ncbi:unnamed protein product [Thelazia callipaeda]|uniref:Solute carrier organic anion transporter family member n=1 Tax=Thelazia callipaeda TaxID=103827 RepID=A0A0N5D475_THECL|nr:unnamed protein product [Thelazia callipaeda]
MEILQGTYLAYVVGILTNLERRFGISSKQSGTLLSLYDIGHTISVVLIGFLANDKHLPRITALGVLFSAVSMFILALPMVLFGPKSYDEASLSRHKLQNLYILENICDPSRSPDQLERNCMDQKDEHFLAFCILCIAQVLAGIAAAPFNTIAYIYIDNNLLTFTFTGLLSSMYAFAPSFGFALSASVTRIYTTVVDVPPNVTIESEEWVGAWWLGFIICGILYLIASVPIFFFPKNLLEHNVNCYEMQHLRDNNSHFHYEHQIAISEDNSKSQQTFLEEIRTAAKKFPELIKNPVYTSMVIGWMFGSYLSGGYSTYLPKYIETQFSRSASVADIYSGIISIGSIAVSTAFGGYLLTKFNPSPRKALLFLIAGWSIIVITYLVGMLVGCKEPQVAQLLTDPVADVLNFRPNFADLTKCSIDCHCESVDRFNPVNFHMVNYFSPCHAGCQKYNTYLQKWDSCICVGNGAVENGLYVEECHAVFIYVANMFTGLFFGNLFFMTTMMVVLRSVYDDEKVLALSFASCITNIFGFIPSPIIFGWLIDGECQIWHSKCAQNHGNCAIYNNEAFRYGFHVASAIFQVLAVFSAVICYYLSKKFTFPEEEEGDICDEHIQSRESAVQTAL